MLLKMQPDATVTKLQQMIPLKRPRHMAAFRDGLRARPASRAIWRAGEQTAVAKPARFYATVLAAIRM